MCVSLNVLNMPQLMQNIAVSESIFVIHVFNRLYNV